MMQTIFFWGLAALAVVSALAVVLLRKPADNVMALLAAMAAIAGLFALMGAYLAALFQVIIYIGAVLVLFVFVVMILNIRGTEPAQPSLPRWVAASGSGIFLTLGIALIGWKAFAAYGILQGPSGALKMQNTVNEIAYTLFSEHILVFELTSVLLFAAALGAIYLTRKEKQSS